ncbi:MAG: 16S rRNA pseudouridine(516) synthase, partial [Lachnospiraceae bacterium]|nr:16S rRNA pseudouridine(516) synthase [Lachnospiraceae bacterium]
MRLDKYLSDMGIGTRSESKKYIKAGRICVNNETTTDPALHVLAEDVITFDGDRITYEEHIYYLMNKPQGVITATKDNSRKTILDLIKQEDRRKELFPVGRLDKDTEGLLLITNNGALAHHLLSPKHHIEKTYYAEVSGIMTEEDVMAFSSGMEIDGGDICLPA